MKNILSILVISLLFASCSLETEINQNPEDASEKFISNYLSSNYEAIYDDVSLEMKAALSKDLYLIIAKIQEKIYGKMVNAELKNETTGRYQNSPTSVYNYVLTNKKGKTFDMTAEFLRGHLLKNHIDGELWGDEPAFAKSIVDPIHGLMMAKDANEICNLLGKKFPLDQVENLVTQITNTIDGVDHRYESSWMDNDQNNKMMVAFVYGYEGKGFLEYRFYMEEDSYPLAGIFFSPDEKAKLP